MKTTRSIIYRLALCAILLATSLLTACTTRMTVTPVAAIATLEPMADGREDSSDANDANDATTRSQPVATATESATETPSASPTPLPPQPPKLVSREPEHGQELQLGQPLTLVFDQPMDRASVGSAFTTEPELLGHIKWTDDVTLVYTPDASLIEIDQRYKVIIDESAQSAEGLALTTPIVVDLRTVGELAVTSLYPSDGTLGVDVDSTIRVIFNRPVVAMAGIGEPSDLPNPLQIEPALPGAGRWVNTSMYVYEPESTLEPATWYRLAVDGVTGLDGSALAEPVETTFLTTKPHVVAYSPMDGARFLSPDTAISITFDQPVDHDQAQNKFNLFSEWGHAEGEFAWVENTMFFTPTHPLQPTEYDVYLRAGVQSASGEEDAATSKDTIWTFTVAGAPTVIESWPVDGDDAFSPYDSIEIQFTNPISMATFKEAFTVTPKVELWSWSRDWDTLVVAGGSFEPSTAYTATLDTSLLGRYGDPLDEPLTLHWTTDALDPGFYLETEGNVGLYSAYDDVIVPIRAVNTDDVTLMLFELDYEDLARLKAGRSWRELDAFAPNLNDQVGTWIVDTSAELNTFRLVTQTLTIDDEPLPSGIYLLDATSSEDEDAQRHLLVVTPYNMVLKTGPDEALVWVTDLADGQPVSGQNVVIYGENGQAIEYATTDDDGLAELALPAHDPWETLLAMVVPPTGGVSEDWVATYGAVSSNWDRSIEPYQFDLPINWDSSAYRMHMYTERGIYRPGQTVYYKGVLRLDDDGTYTLPGAGELISLMVFDDRGREFYSAEIALSDVGSFDGVIHLDESAPLGFYYLQATLGEESFGAGFQVAEYRKPEFEVSVSLDQPDYVNGDTIEATALATYYFGGPLVEADVRWAVIASPYRFTKYDGKGGATRGAWSFSADDEWGMFDAYGGFVAEGTGQTDADGYFRFTLDADISEALSSQRYAIEVSVTDANHQEVSAQGTAIVHMGNYYVGLQPESYVGQAGQEQAVNLVTVDTDGEIRPQQELTIVFSKREWLSIKEVADDGNAYWTNEMRRTPVYTTTVTTGSDGLAQAVFTPDEGGSYYALAQGVDKAGNTIKSGTYLWISSRSYVNWGQPNDDQLDLVADKGSYRPGDTAKILVPSPYQGATKALLTIERGSVIEQQVIDIKSNSEQLAIPIVASYAPNVFVSVTLVQGADDAEDGVASFKLGTVQLDVSTEQQELQVRIACDTDVANPRDTVTYEIAVLDYQGKPVQCELTAQLVDKAVEALTGGRVPDIVNSFYRQRGLGVFTAASLTLAVDRHVLDEAAGAKGGGGGGSEGAMVRESFPDTAYWAAAVETDAEGKAELTVTLPDNLTTWRLGVQAVTRDTRVGDGSHELVSNLELMVRPMAPRFATVGDQPVLGAVVHNTTDMAYKGIVTLSGDGIEIVDGQQSIDLQGGESKTVYWETTVGGDDQMVLDYRAEVGPYVDQVRVTLPVYRASSRETVGTSGQTDGRALEVVRLPQGVDATQGELTVILEPSLAASMREGVTYLETYPYDCIEQTVSRFLPNVVAFRAYQELGMTDRELAAKLPQMAGQGLQRLYATQNLDGGWGWWPGANSRPELTAYVLLGLVEAQQADLSVDPDTIEMAVSYLYSWLDDAETASRTVRDQWASVLYSLALADRGDLGRAVALYDEGMEMSLYGRALLGMVLHVMDPASTTRTDAIANELADAAILSATGAHWEEDVRSPWTMNTDTRTTAIAIRALTMIDPESGLLPNAVRWLTMARSAGRWETTQENIWAIMALTDYMVATGELGADYAAMLTINEETLVDAQIDAHNLDESITTRVPVSELYLEHDNAVELVRGDGDGAALGYSAFLDYYLPAAEMEALDRGISVSRQYLSAEDPTQVVETASVNDLILVKLTVVAPHDLFYFLLEDYIPAGCEALDPNLQTSRSTKVLSALQRETLGEMADLPAWHWYRYWPSHTELRDEKTVLFAEHLPRGTYEYAYLVRCTTQGQFSVLPAHASEMYEADVFGRSDGGELVID